MISKSIFSSYYASGNSRTIHKDKLAFVRNMKTNGLEPYFYLRYLFRHFPSCPDEEQEKHKSLMELNVAV
jgi:hypothetical protein